MKKTLIFLEKNFMKMVFLSTFGLIVGVKVVDSLTKRSYFDALLNEFISISILDNGNLVTISTVIIGIYFSLYTYILSTETNSFIGRLKDYHEFSLLINMVNRGFVSSFLLVLLSFVNEWLYEKFDIFYLTLIGVLCIFIFGSLIQIAMYYWLIFKFDFKSKYEQLKTQKESDYLDQELREDLKNFLEKQKLEEQQDKYKKLSEK